MMYANPTTGGNDRLRAVSVALLLSTSGLVFAATADAKPRQAAQVVSGNTNPGKTYAAPRGKSGTGIVAKRVEYRYPDQPNVVYGASDGPRMASPDAPPIRYSSQEAIPDDLARRQAAAQPVLAKPIAAPRDPNLTSGAFDARAAARSAGQTAAIAPQPAPRFQPPAPKPVYAPAPVYSAPIEQGRTQAVALAPVPVAATAPVVGAPYQAKGIWYVPTHEPNFNERGRAGVYSSDQAGRATASGEAYDPGALTAAHPTLPIPSLVQVTNTATGRTAIVRLNDRGPFGDGNLIAVSEGTASALGLSGQGGEVQVEYVGAAPAIETRRAAAPAMAPRPSRSNQPARSNQPVQTASLGGGSVGQSFYIQAGSFGEIGNAHRLEADLSAFGQTSVVDANVGGATYFRVLMGPWSSREAAESARDQLSSRGLASGIVVTFP
jgi:rare lipoprotein A